MKKIFKKSTISIIVFTLFLDMIGIGTLIPIIPQLLANPHSKLYLLPPSMPISSGYILLGLLLAIYPFMQFLAAPILGQLSDKFGRKKILLTSISGSCLSLIVFATGIAMKNISIIFIARAFAGATGGNIAAAQAAVADITKPEDRARNFGLLGAALGMGMIVGPIIGGKLSDPSLISWFDSTTPFWFVSVLSFLNLLSVLFFFKETNHNLSNDAAIIWSKSVKNIIKAYSFAALRINFIAHFLFQLGWTFFVTFIGVVMIHKFNYNQGDIGSYFAFIGLCIALSQIFLIRFISKHFSEGQVLKISYAGVGMTLLLYFLASTTLHIILIGPVSAAFVALSVSNTTSLISRSVESKIQGEILGVTASIQAFAASIPPVIGGYIAGSISPESPILVASIITMLAGFLFYFFFKRQVNPFSQPDAH